MKLPCVGDTRTLPPRALETGAIDQRTGRPGDRLAAYPAPDPQVLEDAPRAGVG